MNDLMALSDTDLERALDALKERELALQTESGRNYMIGKMRECIGLLETWGYKFDGNEVALARLWADGLQEEFVRLGADGIQKAVTKWAEADNSEYRSFPKIPWIIESCKALGGDPRVEKGRRMQERAERQMEEEHKAEMAKFKKDHPELWAKIQERAERMRGRGNSVKF